MSDNLRWFDFRQNNSGGRFDYDKDLGNHVFIQATSLPEAISKAEYVGVYFDGCRDGRDCDCCGDRWSEPWREEGSAELPRAHVFGKGETDWIEAATKPAKKSARGLYWYSVAHYADGRRAYLLDPSER